MQRREASLWLQNSVRFQSSIRTMLVSICPWDNMTFIDTVNNLAQTRYLIPNHTYTIMCMCSTGKKDINIKKCEKQNTILALGGMQHGQINWVSHIWNVKQVHWPKKAMKDFKHHNGTILQLQTLLTVKKKLLSLLISHWKTLQMLEHSFVWHTTNNSWLRISLHAFSRCAVWSQFFLGLSIIMSHIPFPF